LRLLLIWSGIAQSGTPRNPGIIPQAVTEIFSYIIDVRLASLTPSLPFFYIRHMQHPEKEFLLYASYLEIYNETIKDLLAPESGPLKIRQDENVCVLPSRLKARETYVTTS
jgi:centromeric protein E